MEKRLFNISGGIRRGVIAIGGHILVVIGGEILYAAVHSWNEKLGRWYFLEVLR